MIKAVVESRLKYEIPLGPTAPEFSRYSAPQSHSQRNLDLHCSPEATQECRVTRHSSWWFTMMALTVCSSSFPPV